MKCKTADCSTPAAVKGLCKRCYSREYQRKYRPTYDRKNRNKILVRRRKWYHKNGESLRQENRDRYHENPTAQWERDLRKLGLTPEAYERLLKAQGGGCALCGKTEQENGRRLAVDHCHETNRVRGILCNNHNRGLGLFSDDPTLLRIAASYLERSAEG